MIRLGAAVVLLALAGCPGPGPGPGPGPMPSAPDAGPIAAPSPDAGPPPEPPPWENSNIDWSTPPAPAALREVRPPTPVRLTLKNGLTVLVVERPRLPIVSAELVVPSAGSQEDPAALAGLAALTGDLLDEGAGRFGAVELAAELERLGSDLGIALRPDAAVISLDCLSETLDQSLGLLAAVVSEPRLEAADFERVKSERVAALRRRRDRPANVGGLVLERVIFGAHAYGHPTSGYEKTVAAIGRDQAVDFWKRRWRPAGATLVLVGDVRAASLRARLEATLGRWRGRAAGSRPQLRLPAAPAPRLVVVDKPGTTQSAVVVGRVLWRRNQPRIHAIQVANTVLGGSFTSRLMQRLREQLGWSYGASSYFWFGRGAGTWSAEASIDTEHTAEGVREMLALIDSMSAAPLAADELARARTLLLRRLPQELESNAGVAGLFAGLVIEGLPLDWYGKRGAALARVTAADAHAAATAAWARDQLVVVVVGDLARIRAGLLGLGLGPAIEVDPDGNMRGPFDR